MRAFQRILCIAVVLVATLVVADLSVARTLAQQPPPGQEEFVPLSEIPPEEQIPAFTLVALAYGAVWVVLAGYVWSVSKRLQAVEGELTAITRNRN